VVPAGPDALLANIQDSSEIHTLPRVTYSVV
jgi:hypothetical protein